MPNSRVQRSRRRPIKFLQKPLQQLLVQKVLKLLLQQTHLPARTKKPKEKGKRLHLPQRRRERRIRNVKRRRIQVLTLVRR